VKNKEYASAQYAMLLA